MEEKFYVTTPIYYINAEPHIGHAYSTIAADVLARWHRLAGKDVFFLTGLDENSAKTVEAAEEAGWDDIQTYADTMAEDWLEVWEALNITNDDFVRTTQERHRKNVREFFNRLRDGGDVYKDTYEGLYCEGCEGYLSESDLVDGKCPYHDEEPEYLEEENYFFKLSKYEDRIRDHIEENPGFIQPESRRNEVLSFIEEGLEDVSISRPHLDWGINVPWDEDQTVWVWFDALINYMLPGDYWPADLHIIAKDILRFHCVIWPGMLIAAGYELPKRIYSHGFLTVEGQKISKSLGNVIDPVYLADKYSADALRYYLIREKTLGQDGNFSERDLVTRFNSELADTLGNFVHRVLTFINNNFDGKVPEGEEDEELVDEMREKIESAEELMEEVNINQALIEVISLARTGNEYFQECAPWEVDLEKASECLYNCANLADTLSVSLYPFIPKASERVADMLNVEIEDLDHLGEFRIEYGHEIKKPSILFKKVEFEEKEEVKEDMVSFDEFQKLDLRIGRVEKVEDIEKSDNLYRIQMDLGGETKQSVAGMKGTYSPDELEGSEVPVLANLEPSEIMGVKSECMILAAVVDEKPVLLNPDREVEVGAKVM